MNAEKQYIAIGDIHGNIALLRQLIEESIKFDAEKHILVFLGDYLDRGADSAAVIEYLMDLKTRFPESVIILKGNHELMAYQYLTGVNKWVSWQKNGGDKTVQSFDRVMSVCKAVLIPFIEAMPSYFETKDFIFVHGGIVGNKKPEHCTEYSLLWEREIQDYTGKKTLVVGHSPVNEVTVLSNRVIQVDTGAYFSGKLSAYNTATGEVYQAVKVVTVSYVSRTVMPYYEQRKKAIASYDFGKNSSLTDEQQEIQKAIMK
jgi:serine/threonine protein phosphatase 1